jgi:ClpP class serine protease
MKTNFNNILTQYNFNKNKPILATDEFYNAFKSTVEKVKADGFIDDINFSASDNSPYDLIGYVAVLDFVGFTVGNATPLEEMFFGVVSLQGFCNRLQMAVNDDRVNKVVINFDSGGGFIQYLPETSELIQELKQSKPIYAYSSGYMCSAAYEVACNCTNIITSPSATVGCIGVRSEYLSLIPSDVSGSAADGMTESTFDDAGFKVTTFQSGDHKTVGSEFIPLTVEQKQEILSYIKQLGDDFRAVVVANRGPVNMEFMQGDTYTGKEALTLNTNLIDGNVNSLAQFVQLIYSAGN